MEPKQQDLKQTPKLKASLSGYSVGNSFPKPIEGTGVLNSLLYSSVDLAIVNTLEISLDTSDFVSILARFELSSSNSSSGRLAASASAAVNVCGSRA
ncbi:hypothetical protein WICMUC_001952 [Wickerhamomyces mucosus]|uniref:Uncharacterized protein n=1 Tax=Wickerhamomyces mucosus TaxID=1378264 RepID=A0A9P8TG15_9ASCO|nr:hypothetical protein WICMUC_001952 [Wickerhamomyces mucosus]